MERFKIVSARHEKNCFHSYGDVGAYKFVNREKSIWCEGLAPISYGDNIWPGVAMGNEGEGQFGLRSANIYGKGDSDDETEGNKRENAAQRIFNVGVRGS